MKYLPLLSIVMMLLVASCDNDPVTDAVVPTFNSVSVSPSSVSPGANVVASVSYTNKGNNWSRIPCTWTVSGADTSFSMRDTLHMSEEPSRSFKAPLKAGSYTVSLSLGNVEAATLFANGSIYGSASFVGSKNCKLEVIE